MCEVETLDADLSNPRHAQALVGLLDELSLEDGDGPLPEDVRGKLIAGLKSHGKAFVLLAQRKEELIGAAVCLQGYSTFAARPLINIHDLVVGAAHRGQGVGRRLLRAVEARARELNCAKVTLEVRADNTAAQRLYASEGFGSDGRKTFFLRKLVEPSLGDHARHGSA